MPSPPKLGCIRRVTTAPELLEQYFILCGVPETRKQLYMLTELTGTAKEVVLAWFDARVDGAAAERARERTANRSGPLSSLTDSSLVDEVYAGHILDAAAMQRLRNAAKKEESRAKRAAEERTAADIAERERSERIFAAAQVRQEATEKAAAEAAVVAAAAAEITAEAYFLRSCEEKEALNVYTKVVWMEKVVMGWELARLRAEAAHQEVR